MSIQLLHDHINSFHLTLTPASIDTLKKCLDPFNYKYRRPLNIMMPDDNPPEMKKTPLTQKVLQLSLMKLCIDVLQVQKKPYLFGSFCQFFVQNSEEMCAFVSDSQNSTSKLIVFLMNQMLRSWMLKSDFNIEVKKNTCHFNSIIQCFKSILQSHVNNVYIKTASSKIGHIDKMSAVSPASQLGSKLQPSMLPLSVPAIYPSNSDAQNRCIEVQVDYEQPYKWQECMLNVYLGLVGMWCFNDQSKTAALNISQPKSNIFANDTDEEESAYFGNEKFLIFLAHSLRILFHLSTGSKDLELITELFVTCSHCMVFRQNQEKPVSFLRMVLYGEKKLEKKEWQERELSKQEESHYLDLIKQYLMLDPGYRERLLSLMREWISMGVQTSNWVFLCHWRVLISTVNNRVFESQLQNQLFSLLLQKSQGNKHNKQHVAQLISELIEHLDAEILIKNSDRIFALEEFVDFADSKLLDMCFGYCFALVKNKKVVGNKVLVNRVIGMYLDLWETSDIKREVFMEFYAMCVENSVESGEKLLNEANLKRVHLVEEEERITRSVIASSKRLVTSKKDTPVNTEETPLQQSNIAASRITASQQIMSNFYQNLPANNTEPSLQLHMLKALFSQRKRSQSYFTKFISKIHPSFFTPHNLPTYQTYAQHLLHKLTEHSSSSASSLFFISNPAAFQRLLGLYETFHAIVDQNKVLSHQLYQTLFLVESLVETAQVSDRVHWFVRKLKYLFLTGPNSSSISTATSALKFVSQIFNTFDSTPVPNSQVDRKSSNQMAQGRNSDTSPKSLMTSQKSSITSQTFWTFVKQTFLKLKNKTSLLIYICLFCLRYYHSSIKLQKKSQERRSQKWHDYAAELSELYVFLQTNEYASILSPSLLVTNALFILYNIVLNNEYAAMGNKFKDDDQCLEQIDENPLLTEIRRILVLQFDVFTPYLVNEFLYMFTTKQSSAEKLLVYMNLSSFLSIPLISRLLPIIKVVKEVTCRKQMTMERRQVVLPFYNHVEFSFVELDKTSLFSMRKDERSYKLTFEVLLNWELRAENFISFCTDWCKYKLIISKEKLSLLYRKEGSSSTQMSQKYRLKKQLGEKAVFEIGVRGKQLSMSVNKKCIEAIMCDGEIQSVKLEMINGMMLKRVSVARSVSEQETSVEPLTQIVEFCKSFTIATQLQLQIKLKDLSLIHQQAACTQFPYAKYFFLLKQLIRHNPELADQQVYELISRNLSEVYLRMLDNSILISGCSGRVVGVSKGNVEGKKVNAKGDEAEDMWRSVMKALNEAFINQKNNYCLMRKRTQTTSKILRKYSHDTSLFKNTLTHTNSANDQPTNIQTISNQQPQHDDFLKPPLLPNLIHSPRFISSEGFCIYLLQVAMRPEMWEYYSDKAKLQIADYLKNLVGVKEFFISVENQRFQVFYELLNLLQKITDKELVPQFNFPSQTYDQSPISPLTPSHQLNPLFKTLGDTLNFIILNHHKSQLLKHKFKYFFYLAEMGKSSLVKNQFYSLLDSLSRDLLAEKAKEKALSIGKWLFLEFQQFEFVFMNCPLATKVRILDYLTEFESEDKHIFFMKQLMPEVIFELRMWLLIYLKKMLFKLKMKINVLQYMKILGEVTCVLLTCWQDMKAEEEREELLKILQEEIGYIGQRQKDKQPISKQLLSILSQESFVRFLVTVIEQFVLNPTRRELSVQRFGEGVFEVIFGLEKGRLLEVLISYRRYSNKNVGLLMYPLKLQLARRLKIYQLSCLLQYILECILSIQSSLSEQQTTCFALQLKTYLEQILKNYEEISELEYGLLYCYPKVYHLVNCSSPKDLAQKVNKVSKLTVKELRGGVYFKMMIVVAHLIQLKPNQDMAWIVEELLFRNTLLDTKTQKKGQRQLHAAFRAINDFSQVQTFTRQRSYIEKIANLSGKKHRAYCVQNDAPYDPLQVVSSKLVKFEQENDLSPYCLDYFLMKLVNYLQWQDPTQDPLINQINHKYSQLLLKALKKFPLIYNDITEKHLLSHIAVNDYSELLLLNTEDMLITQKVTSPSRVQFQLDHSTRTKDYLDQSFMEKLQTQSPSKSTNNIQLYESQRFSKTVGKKDDQFLNPAANLNPKKVSSRKKSFHAIDVTQNKDFLLDQVKKDHTNWRKKCLQKQFNKFFRNQAKQLLIIELLFTYFVDNTAIKPMSQVLNKENRMIQKYFQSFEKQLEKYENQMGFVPLSTKQLIQIFNLKRLSPYLLEKPPILKVKGSSLPNMCMPMLSKIPKPNYKLRQNEKIMCIQSVIGEDLRMEMFGMGSEDGERDESLQIEQKQDEFDFDIDQRIAYTPKKSINSDSEKSFRPNSCIYLQENEFQLETGDIKTKETNYCELVTRNGVYFCEWKIISRQKIDKCKTQAKTQKPLIEYILQLQSFISKPLQCPRELKYGSPVSNLLSQQKVIEIAISGVRQIFFRKFNQIQNNSVEMFCEDGRSHFLCLYSKEKAERITKEISMRKGLKVVKNAAAEFEKRAYTSKWVNGEIDNFTYLMMLNKFSGRSFCDTNQYPVFPWVISDFKSKTLNLSEASTYRDLTKPIGALNPQKLRRFYQKYHLQSEETGIFLYGSHFSTSLFIYYFLVRMEPFSTLHQQMQGGSWDAPDRLFGSMEHMWDSLMSPSSSTDIKESIPEFYYFPFFLKNTNSIDLGIRQSGEPVNDVILPPWASSPEDFIFKMRSALESNYVSLNLPYWIDLIFGADQKNIKRHNLYHPLSYSENIHIDKIPKKDLEARICQISYFGQHPIKLFSKPHKLKKLAMNSIFSRESLPGLMLRGSSMGKRESDKCVMLTLPLHLSIVKIEKSSKTQNSTICCLKIKFYTLSVEFDIEIDPKVQSMQNVSKKINSSLKEWQKGSKRRQSLSNPDKNVSTLKMRDPHYLGYSEKACYAIQSRLQSNSLIFYPSSNPIHVLSSYSFDQNYTKHLYTETFVILYGQDGIMLANWNFETIFCYRKKAIDCCCVDDLAMFFVSKDGKIFVYDIIEKSVSQIFDLSVCQEEIRRKQLKSQKEMKSSEMSYRQQKIYSTQMELFSEKKLISASWEDEYKIVAVANESKMFVLNYKQFKRNWTNIEKD